MTAKGQGWQRTGSEGSLVWERSLARLQVLTLPAPRGPSTHQHLLGQTWHLISFSPPKPWGQLLLSPHLTREKTRLNKVNCSDLETLLKAVSLGLIPDLSHVTAPPTTLLPPFPFARCPLPLHWVTSLDPGWTGVSLPMLRQKCCLLMVLPL